MNTGNYYGPIDLSSDYYGLIMDVAVPLLMSSFGGKGCLLHAPRAAQLRRPGQRVLDGFVPVQALGFGNPPSKY